MAADPKFLAFARRWRNKKVLIMGLGRHGGGLGVAQFFAKIGAQVIITDLKSPQELKPSLAKLKKFQSIEYHLGKHFPKDFQTARLIIKNPAVPENSPYLKIAQAKHIPIDTDIGIFFKLCPAPIIGITGTKGKSTTAALTYQLIKSSYQTHLAGNIRISPLTKLSQIKASDKVVLELSSWQLEGLTQHQISPQIALVTRLDKDHLNRHSSLKKYFAAKKLIFKFQTPQDHLFLNAQDPRQKAWAKQAPSQVHFYDLSDPLLKYLKLPGPHNQENTAGALAIARLFKIPEARLKKALQNFQGLEGRLQLVQTIKEVQFINDTTATAPVAVISALKSFKQKVILIAGGEDKNLDYQDLAQEIPLKTKALILLPGSATAKLKKALAKTTNAELKNSGWLKEVPNIQQAVKAAWRIAQPRDIVLLSPGAASFNQFADEFERGQAFRQAIGRLKP